MRSTILSLGGIFVIVAVVFGIISWVGEIPGNYVDWVFGLLAFWWLLVVTIIPWNLYFSSKELLRDLKISEEKEIEIETKDKQYLQKSVKVYLILALFLHIASAIGFYLIAMYDVTHLGNYAAIIALSLTFIRPLIRLYQHILARLRSIRQKIRYPRKDIVSLTDQVNNMKNQLNNLEGLVKGYHKELDSQVPGSTFYNYYKQIEKMEERITEQDTFLKNAKFGTVSVEGQDEFMGQLKGLIRFIKDA